MSEKERKHQEMKKGEGKNGRASQKASDEADGAWGRGGEDVLHDGPLAIMCLREKERTQNIKYLFG